MKDYIINPPFTPAIDYKKELNPQQYEVVTKAKGPSLILAGAGSGKTRVLIYRLAYLIDKGASPENILLVTFTNKAAKEMITRAESLLSRNLSGMWIGTFHHIGNIILRKEAKLLGFSPNFTIIDREDAKDLAQNCLEELNLSKQGKLFPKKDLILNVSSKSTNSLKDIEDVISESYSHIEEYTQPIKRVLKKYQKKKKEANLMDFDDLLFFWLEVMKKESIREKYSRQFNHILIDEYQDTNRLQFEILKKLSSASQNILAVGDDAQSIYSFRSAEIKNVLNFPQTFKDTKIFKLEINYRSTPEILDLANAVINNNKKQFPKHLRTIKKNHSLPVLIKADDTYKQASFIARQITKLYQEGIPLQKISVLFRSRYLALELEVELMQRSIPYIIRGGIRFFEQAHIKDVLSYLKIIVNPKDEISFKRALSLYPGIGRSYAYRIWEKSVKENLPQEEILKSLPKKAKEGTGQFSLLLASIKDEPRPEKALNKVIKKYADYCYLNFDNPEERIADLEELSKMAKSSSSIRNLLENLSAFEEFKGEAAVSPEAKEGSVVLSTIHQAKGLEWQAVFILGCSEYDFPHPKALNSQEQLEEERRLFYVAITRAKKYLYMAYPKSKYTYRSGIVIARPSMFIQEIAPELYDEWDK